MNRYELTKVEMTMIRADRKNMVTMLTEKQHTMIIRGQLATSRVCSGLFVYLKLRRLNLIQFDKHIRYLI